MEQRRDMMPDGGAQALFEPVRAALAQAPEAQRYRLLAGLLGELAEHAAGANGSERERADSLAKRAARLGEEKASLEDALAAANANLSVKARQLEAEQQRASELDRIVADQRTRLQATQQEVGDLEQQLVAKNSALNEAEKQVETLTIKLQRAEKAAGDTSRADALADNARGLGNEIQKLRDEIERLRVEKDAAIEALKTELLTAKSAAGGGEAQLLRNLWNRLAVAKPPLSGGNQNPPVQAAERLVDTVIELTRFITELDQSVAPFLAGFTKHNPQTAMPWDAYARSPDLQTKVKEVLDAEQGKPVDVIRKRLSTLRKWIVAAIVGGDSALESIAQELETQLRGPVGMGTDPNRKVKDYLKDDGHLLLLQHVRELRGQKLAEAFGRGS